MSALLPIFPLPGVVLFPGADLPLHIFENRYRTMIRMALPVREPIGMVLLQPGYESEYEGAPPIHPVGCAGEIIRCDPLPDGRFNLLLRGLWRFRVLEEDRALPFRRVSYRRLDDPPSDIAQRALESQVKRELLSAFLSLGALLQGREMEGAPDTPPVGLDELVNQLAFAWPGPAERKQELLTTEGALERGLRLKRLLEADADEMRLSRGLPAPLADGSRIH